jgi:hypothetical protein
MLYLICAGIYILGMILFVAWDALIGFPVKWYEEDLDSVPLSVATIFWPISVPVLLIITFSNFLKGIKKKRILKENLKEAQRIRIKQEEQEILEQVERELSYERKSQNSS